MPAYSVDISNDILTVDATPDILTATAAPATAAQIPGGGVSLTSSNQSLGAELLTNGDLSAWTSDNPDGWVVVGESGSDPEVTERNPAQTHGDTVTTGGAANMYSSGTNFQPRLVQSAFTNGSWYQVLGSLTGHSSGELKFQSTNTNPLFATLSAVNNFSGLRQINDSSGGSKSLFLLPGTSPNDFTSDDLSVKQITLNTQQTGYTNGDGSYVVRFTLPGSPKVGQRMYLLYRIVDSDNRWQAYLEYDGSQWNAYLDSVSSLTETNRISVLGVGTPTMLGVYINGNDHKLYTGTGASVDAAIWTQRGGTVTNATHNTADGYNMVYNSDFTFHELYRLDSSIF